MFRQSQRRLWIFVILASLSLVLLLNGTLHAQGNSIEIISVSNTIGAGNAESDYPSISADGQFVVFASTASNLVPGDTNICDFHNCVDIFLRDRFAGTTTRISISNAGQQANGDSYTPSISANGRYVVFTSNANNLIPGDAGGGTFLYDRQTGLISRVSVAIFSVTGNGTAPSVSDDGRYVVFASSRDDLVPGDTCDTSNMFAGCNDVFLFDRQTQQTSLVSVSSAGIQGDLDSYDPSITADGRYVTFTSQASNLVSNDNNTNCLPSPLSCPDIFLRDLQTGQTTLVSVSSGGTQGNYESSVASISLNGDFIVFNSTASNLISGDTGIFPDIFLRDLQQGKTTRVNVSSSDAQANDGNQNDYTSFGWAGHPSISADGRFVVFHSIATNLVANDTNNQRDIFVHDNQTHETVRVNVSVSGVQTDADSDFEMISADGHYIMFRSAADNLVPGYENGGKRDIFVVSNPLWTAVDAPIINYSTSPDTTLTWTRIAWAVAYQIQLDTDQNFSNPTDYFPGTQLYQTIDSFAVGTYYWRVRAQNANGKWGAWSTTQSFTIAAP